MEKATTTETNKETMDNQHNVKLLSPMADVLDQTRLRPLRLDYGHFNISWLFSFSEELCILDGSNVLKSSFNQL